MAQHSDRGLFHYHDFLFLLLFHPAVVVDMVFGYQSQRD
jgi:hypothetical protein